MQNNATYYNADGTPKTCAEIMQKAGIVGTDTVHVVAAGSVTPRGERTLSVFKYRHSDGTPVFHHPDGRPVTFGDIIAASDQAPSRGGPIAIGRFVRNAAPI